VFVEVASPLYIVVVRSSCFISIVVCSLLIFAVVVDVFFVFGFE